MENLTKPFLEKAEETKANLLTCLRKCYPDQVIDLFIKGVTIHRTYDGTDSYEKLVFTFEMTIRELSGYPYNRSNHFEVDYLEQGEWIDKIKELAKTPFKYSKDDLLIIPNKDKGTYQYCRVFDRYRTLKYRIGIVDTDSLHNQNTYKVKCYDGTERDIYEGKLFQHQDYKSI